MVRARAEFFIHIGFKSFLAIDSRAQNSPTIAELSLIEQYTLSIVSTRAGEGVLVVSSSFSTS